MEGMFTGKMFLVLPVANRQTLGPGQRETIKKCHLVLGGFSEAQSLLLNATQKTKYKRHGHITLVLLTCARERWSHFPILDVCEHE